MKILLNKSGLKGCCGRRQGAERRNGCLRGLGSCGGGDLEANEMPVAMASLAAPPSELYAEVPQDGLSEFSEDNNA